MMNQLSTVLAVLVIIKTQCYTPDWDSLDSRPLPKWYDDAKFGIFMHWGVYAVPSHSEWFWWNWMGEGEAAVVEFMRQNYKPGFQYADFAPQFTAELFNADTFADIVNASGAKYFVLTSKHHEGFTMYPSNYSWNWNSLDVGPHRDLVGELSTSMRKAGVRFGLYYSQYEWFHPLYLKDKAKTFSSQEYVEMVVKPQLAEIVNKYHPEVIWSDGDWEASWQYWNATNFLAWLYTSSPVKNTVVVNDRWGIGVLCKHGDFLTCSDKYDPGVLLTRKWEKCMTVDRDSWGFRRTAKLADILSAEELVASLARTISCGGNLLLNVGPTHDGRIIPIFEERLRQVGKFLHVNGEAVYGTKPWIHQNDTLTPDVWYTSRMTSQSTQNQLYNPQKSSGTVVYAFVLSWPISGILKLEAPKGNAQTKVSLLGYTGPLRFAVDTQTGHLAIDFSSTQWDRLPDNGCKSWVLRFEHLETDRRKPLVQTPRVQGEREYEKILRKGNR